MLHVERLSNGSHDNAASTGQLDGAVVDDQIRQDAGVEIRNARIRFEVPAEGRTSSIEGLGRGLSTQKHAPKIAKGRSQRSHSLESFNAAQRSVIKEWAKNPRCHGFQGEFVARRNLRLLSESTPAPPSRPL